MNVKPEVQNSLRAATALLALALAFQLVIATSPALPSAMVTGMGDAARVLVV